MFVKIDLERYTLPFQVDLMKKGIESFGTKYVRVTTCSCHGISICIGTIHDRVTGSGTNVPGLLNQMS